MNHSFNIEYAEEFGIEEAIIIENFIFWIKKNRANKKHSHTVIIDTKKEERTFTYNSASALSELFPYMNEKKIYRVMTSLVEQEVLIKGNYNSNTYDRTLWYAFKDEIRFLELGKSISRKKEMEISETEIHLLKTGNHYTDINTDVIPIINTDEEEEIPFPSQSKFDEFKNYHERKLGYKDDAYQVDVLATKLDYSTELYDKILEAKNKSNWAPRRSQPNNAKYLLKAFENESLDTSANNEMSELDKLVLGIK